MFNVTRGADSWGCPVELPVKIYMCDSAQLNFLLICLHKKNESVNSQLHPVKKKKKLT